MRFSSDVSLIVGENERRKYIGGKEMRGKEREGESKSKRVLLLWHTDEGMGLSSHMKENKERTHISCIQVELVPCLGHSIVIGNLRLRDSTSDGFLGIWESGRSGLDLGLGVGSG